MSESVTPSSPPEVIIKYSSYTPAQKKATKKYRETHKELVNEQRRKYYNERKLRDPAFVEYKRQKAKEYYARKKLVKSEVVPDVTPEVKIEETKVLTPVIEAKPEEPPVVPAPIPNPPKDESPKKKVKKDKKK